MYVEELGKELTGRLLEIWNGTAAGLTEEQMAAYREAWRREAKEGPRKPPNLLKQILAFGKAFTKHVIAGMPSVSDETYKERLAICRECPSKTEDWRCLECGCHLEVKAGWATTECPKGRWPLKTVEEASPPKPCGCGS